MRSSIPTWREAVLGGILWGASMALCALAALDRVNERIDPHTGTLAAVYFIGGLLAFAPGLHFARLSTGAGRADTRFAGAFVFLGGATAVLTALCYALQHMRGQVGPGDLLDGPVGLFHVGFAALGGLAQFAALGMRLFAPEGALVLTAVSIWTARQAR